MKIAIIGSGRVGLSLGALLAESGFEVFMTDKNLDKKQSVEGKAFSFYEPGLKESLLKNQNSLQWTRWTEKICSADIIFLCLNTPIKKRGDLDLTEVFHWARWIAEKAHPHQILLVKSTFPLGSNKKIQDIIYEGKSQTPVITCPEFLRQGQALKDLSHPERLVIGSRDLSAGKKIEEFYKKFSNPRQVIHTNPETAELSKLAGNAFLALKISFINEFSALCESLEGDPKKLQLILGSDSRIGKDFLNPGLGYGGYCLPKDLQISIYEGEKRNQEMSLLKATQKINNSLTEIFFQKIRNYYKSLKGISLAFWGISFKKNTDDLKNSPALALACRLLKAGAELHIYDPLFTKERVAVLFNKKEQAESKKNLFQKMCLSSASEKSPEDFLRENILNKKVIFYKSLLESLGERQGLIIGSDEEEFQKIALTEVKKRLSHPFLVDGRGLFSLEELREAGFSFYQRGIFFTQNKKFSAEN